MIKEIHVATKTRNELVDITHEIKNFLSDAKARSGIVVVFVPHTSAGVTINENADPDVTSDITGFMTELIPQDSGFTHAEGNSDSHIKSSLFSPSLSLLVEDGSPRLGQWQGVYFAEFDGPRSRKVWLKYLSD